MEALLPQAIEGKLFFLAPAQVSFSIGFFFGIEGMRRTREDKVFYFHL